jgi:hypothetical protein
MSNLASILLSARKARASAEPSVPASPTATSMKTAFLKKIELQRQLQQQ